MKTDIKEPKHHRLWNSFVCNNVVNYRNQKHYMVLVPLQHHHVLCQEMCQFLW